MDKHAVLKQYFGHDAFRPGQEALVDGILSGRDALGIMPTGGGKSLCYQVPALLLPGVTLVISPLISLMKDQVASLEAAGVSAGFLNSSQTLEESRQVWGRVRRGECRLLYVAPERLENARFLELAAELVIPLVAVDEAHCISQWGQDFRPSYLKISSFVSTLPRRPVLAAFTATATAQVQEDVVRQLDLRTPVRVVTGFDRPNLFFDVRRPRKKLPELLALLEERRGRSGIVYCATRSNVEKVWAELESRGFSAARYHAGLDEEERRISQEDFQYDRRQIMVATNAFGMGIDKSNVSFVLHYNMPKNLESYYQEAGRGGRDGEAADCVLLYGAGDVATARVLLTHGEGGDPEPRELERLNAMVDYCKTNDCLRGRILDYFGQPHPERCGGCGNCQGMFSLADVTVQAQMILSCIKRVRDRLGYYVGAALIVQVLRGGHSQRIKELGLDQLSTYGLMREETRERVRAYLDCLEAAECVYTETEHGTLRPGAKANAVLFHGERVHMLSRVERQIEAPPRQKAERVPAAPPDQSLLAALRAERTRLARQEGVPPYIIFSNAALADMAARVPRTPEEFLEVSGVGQVKARRYGSAFLAVIAAWREE
ncbi:MAG: DNA helicase RecQ [Oscillospiraceae bacterium]|nr:DNA helicase RecQ [Oscillospiraceae bacterium]